MMAKSEFKERPACALKCVPLPESIVCPQCEQKVEIWSDEEQAVCPQCGKSVTR